MNKFLVNAFANSKTGGNPAVVCILDQWVDDLVLQKMAMQHGMPATSFIVRAGQYYQTRWFAPEYEIDLCGHGAIASGLILFQYINPQANYIELTHPKHPVLKLERNKNLYQLELPIKNITPLAADPVYELAIGSIPKEVYQFNVERLLLVLESENEVASLTPTLEYLKQINHRGIIVTASCNKNEFVYRVFYPGKSLYEDQATGSAHCYLIPYWATKRQTQSFHARQLSARGGEMWASLLTDRIILSGEAIEIKDKEINCFC